MSYLLIVDDERINRNVLEDLLEGEYEMAFSDNGQQCLDMVKERAPDLILLDVNMPILNGLETCKIIKADDDLKNIPVCFVSALATAEQKMEGYEAGGDDYLTKPFNENELVAKINLLLKIKEEKLQEKSAKDFATDMAMTVMTSAAEAGEIGLFLQNIMSLDELSQVEKELERACESFALSACVYVKYADKEEVLHLGRVVTPIEEDILRETFNHSDKKIFMFSNRCLIKNKRCVILIRIMPEDEDKVGRYKDHLAVMIDGLDEKLFQFEEQYNKQKHYFDLKKTTSDTREKLTEIANTFHSLRQENSLLMSNLMQEMDNLFINLGLSDEQESILMATLEKADKKTDEVYAKGDAFKLVFDDVIDKFNRLE